MRCAFALLVALCFLGAAVNAARLTAYSDGSCQTYIGDEVSNAAEIFTGTGLCLEKVPDDLGPDSLRVFCSARTSGAIVKTEIYNASTNCASGGRGEVTSTSGTCIVPASSWTPGGGLVTIGSFKIDCADVSSSSSTCFPADSTVQLEDGNMMRMDALKVGHNVRVGAKDHSEVFMFSHQYTDAEATFVELRTATGILRLTPGHYLYVNGVATQARDAKVGDHLEAANGTPAAITGVATVRATGLYNPHTLHGDVVVNGFRTTTYTDAIHPTMAHALLAPARALYAMNVTV